MEGDGITLAQDRGRQHPGLSQPRPARQARVHQDPLGGDLGLGVQVHVRGAQRVAHAPPVHRLGTRAGLCHRADPDHGHPARVGQRLDPGHDIAHRPHVDSPRAHRVLVRRRRDHAAQVHDEVSLSHQTGHEGCVREVTAHHPDGARLADLLRGGVLIARGQNECGDGKAVSMLPQRRQRHSPPGAGSARQQDPTASLAPCRALKTGLTHHDSLPGGALQVAGPRPHPLPGYADGSEVRRAPRPS